MGMDRTRIGAPRLPGIGSHQSAVPRSDDWLTPLFLIDRLGPFDCDPCASVHAPARIAPDHWTIEADGLTAEWNGRVWLNPPYSEVTPWMARMAVHDPGGIALVFARTETRWWQQWVWPHADAILFLENRLAFIEAATGRLATHNAGGPSALIAYSEADAIVLQGCGLAGALVSQVEMTPGQTVSDLLLPSNHAGDANPLGGTHMEPDDRLFEDQPRL